MKKFLVVFSAFLIALSLISCNKKTDTDFEDLTSLDNFDIVKTKDIVLGREVDSVVLTTKEGEKITIDNTADFYEIFDKIGNEYKVGKEYSCSAEMKLQDKNKAFVNMNGYNLDGVDFYEFRTKIEGDDAVGAIEEYSYSKDSETSMFARYIYKDEKALGGFENGANGNTSYQSDAYSTFPNSSTEFVEIHSSSAYIRKTFQVIDFFEYYEPYVTSTKTYDYNEFVTREYKLYENYIVFKQTAPFLNCEIGPNNPEILYQSFLNSNCAITQEAYCNVETGEIELIKVYGETFWHTAEYLGRKLELNMQIYVHDTGSLEVEKKILNLINYVKTNTN